MCTIGAVKAEQFSGMFSFKQCDLDKLTYFETPTIEQGLPGIKYMKFMRDGSEGGWAGINNYGVSFVAADSYLEKDASGNLKMRRVTEEIFKAYAKIISDFKNAKDAKEYMCDFYKTFPSPDILLISDSESMFFIETNNGKLICTEKKKRYFTSTNHFRMLYSGVEYKKNHSTYLRLEKSELILQAQPNINGIVDVLSDQYYGNSVFSICRISPITPDNYVPEGEDICYCPDQESKFFTQASVIFSTNGSKVNLAYQINGNPIVNEYVILSDVFGAKSNDKNISARNKEDLIKCLNNF